MTFKCVYLICNLLINYTKEKNEKRCCAVHTSSQTVHLNVECECVTCGELKIKVALLQYYVLC